MENIFDIDIQKAQALRFVNLNRYVLPQNYDDRLVMDLIYPSTVNNQYLQSFQNSDYLRIHYRTDYTVYTISLIDSSGNATIITANQALIFTDANGLSYYNLDIDISNLTGCYYVKIYLVEAEKPINTFVSESFFVSETIKDTVWVEWYGNLRSYDDGMYWTGEYKQGVRLKARLRDYELSQSKNVYENVNYTPQTLKTKPNRAIIMDVDLVAQWIIEKLNIGLNHDNFWVNGVEYNNDEAVINTALGDLLAYKTSITLIELNYQNGQSRELFGELPIIPEVRLGLAVNDTQALAINNTQALGID